jgi:hypothetical protein
MATKRSSNNTNPCTPSASPTQRLADVLKAPGQSVKPPTARSKTTGSLPRNVRGGKTR